MPIQSKRSWLQSSKRVIAKTAIVTGMIIFWGSLIGWPLYNWLAPWF